MVFYTIIKSYNEKRIILNTTVNKFIELINKYKLDNEYSILEVINTDIYTNGRIFLDVENIPFDKPLLIYDIINDFKNYYNLDEYYLTTNHYSNHTGNSYHVYFNTCTSFINMKLMVLNFNSKFSNYNGFIDDKVYSKNRLFRVVYTTCPGNSTVSRNNNSYHELVKGEVHNTIIQNINNLNYYYLDYDKYNIDIKLENIVNNNSNININNINKQIDNKIKKYIFYQNNKILFYFIILIVINIFVIISNFLFKN